MKIRSKFVCLLTAVIAITIGAGCECKRTCPGFNENNLGYIPYNSGDKIHYRNDNGSEIVFDVTERVYDHAAHPKDMIQPDGSCDVAACGVVGARMLATGNTSRSNSNALEVHMAEGITDATCSYKLLDFDAVFTIANGLGGMSGDLMVPNLQLGNGQYNNVLITTADTIVHPSQQIWQVYFCKDGGIIGFRDRQTHSLFYLQ